MKLPETLLTPREAAAAIGVSYPTIKQWILAGKLKTIKTPAAIIASPRLRSSATSPRPRSRPAPPRASASARSADAINSSAPSSKSKSPA